MRAQGARYMNQPSRLVTALLGAAIITLLLASVATLAFVDLGESPSPPGVASAPGGETPKSDSSSSPAPAGPPQPVTDACSLVSLEAVASAIGAKAADLKAEPGGQSLGLKCDFKAPEGEDLLVAFSIQLTEVGDVAFARSTIEARKGGRRIPGIGDLAVLEQGEFSSTIFVVRGSRYVQLRTQARRASDDAMIGLARQAAAKL